MRKLSAALVVVVLGLATTLVAAPNAASLTAHHSPTIDGTWAKRVPADIISGKPDAMTCLSESFCVLADDYGAILVEKRSGWKTSYRLPVHDLLVNDISCA